MARSRSRRPFVVPLPDAQSGLRHVLLRTIPGRLVVGGLAVRLLLILFAVIILLIGRSAVTARRRTATICDRSH